MRPHGGARIGGVDGHRGEEPLGPGEVFEELRVGARLRRLRLEAALERGAGVREALDETARFLADATGVAERVALAAEAARWN